MCRNLHNLHFMFNTNPWSSDHFHLEQDLKDLLDLEFTIKTIFKFYLDDKKLEDSVSQCEDIAPCLCNSWLIDVLKMMTDMMITLYKILT